MSIVLRPAINNLGVMIYHLDHYDMDEPYHRIPTMMSHPDTYSTNKVAPSISAEHSALTRLTLHNQAPSSTPSEESVLEEESAKGVLDVNGGCIMRTKSAEKVALLKNVEAVSIPKHVDDHSSLTSLDSDTVFSGHQDEGSANVVQPGCDLTKEIEHRPLNFNLRSDNTDIHPDESQKEEVHGPSDSVLKVENDDLRTVGSSIKGKTFADSSGTDQSSPGVLRSILVVHPDEKIFIDMKGPWRRLKSPKIATDINPQVVCVGRKRALLSSASTDGSMYQGPLGQDSRSPARDVNKQSTSPCADCCHKQNQRLRFNHVPEVCSYSPSSPATKEETTDQAPHTAQTCDPITQCRCGCHQPGTKLRNTVQFDTVAIRFHAQTIGDNPSVQVGTPISLDWPSEDAPPVSIDVFEAERMMNRRKGNNRIIMQRLALNYYQRRNILMYYAGCSEKEIDKAERNTDKARCQRSFTALFSDYWWVEDAIRSAGRKAKRLVVGRDK